MPATQLVLDFTPITPSPEPEQALADNSWRDVSEIAHGAGFRCPCLVSAELHPSTRLRQSGQALDDQALYDALWTANFTFSLNKADCARFTLKLDGKPTHFKTLKTNRATYLGRVEDF